MSFISYKRCVACRHYGDGECCYHHIYTRGARIDLQYEKWNMISVCLNCHNEFHGQGENHMIEKHTDVYMWFKKNGWIKDASTEKWYHPKAT